MIVSPSERPESRPYVPAHVGPAVSVRQTARGSQGNRGDTDNDEREHLKVGTGRRPRRRRSRARVS